MTEEANLLAQARRLESEAMVAIYDQFNPGLYRYAYRLLGSADLAEECVAETFSRFLQALHKGGGPRKNLRAYLYRVAHNWITDSYRRAPPATEELDPEMQAGSEQKPGEIVIENIETERVRAALAKLTRGQRQVITLKFLEGWKNKEIAEALDSPVGAVKALQHRGLASLRRMLLEDDEVQA